MCVGHRPICQRLELGLLMNRIADSRRLPRPAALNLDRSVVGQSVSPEGRQVGSYCFTSSDIGLSFGLIRNTTVLDVLSVAFRPK